MQTEWRRRARSLLWLQLASSLWLGCGRTGSAATLPDGSRIAIVVQIEPRALSEPAAERVVQRKEIAAWMATDLLAVLKKTGYAATTSAEPVAAGVGRFVLRVWIDDYNLGSHEVRFVIGHSRGAAGLRTHFELYGAAAAKPLLVGNPDVEATSDWRRATRQVDLQTADAVNVRLHQH